MLLATDQTFAKWHLLEILDNSTVYSASFKQEFSSCAASGGLGV